MLLSELLADITMENKLPSYRAQLAGSKALLNLDTDVSQLKDEEIVISDAVEEEFADPRAANDRRLKLVLELHRSEKFYQENLHSIFDIYAEPLRKFSSLGSDDHKVLFCQLEPLISVSTTLFLKLSDAIQTWDPGTTRIGNLFSKQLLLRYDEFYDEYTRIRQLLRLKHQSDEEFVQFCQLRRGNSRNSLQSLLLLPIQRIPEYDEVLRDLLVETDENHPDFDDLNKAFAKIKTMVREREEELQTAENDSKVDRVQERFPNDNLNLQDKKGKGAGVRRRSAPGAVLLKSLGKKHSKDGPLPDSATETNGNGASNPSRLYVVEGPVQLITGLQTQDRYLFLFNDLLLVAKQKSSTTFKLKHRVRVCELWLAECLEEVSETTPDADRSIVIGWPTTNFVATFSSAGMKELWLNKLNEQVSVEKAREEPKTIIIKINTKLEAFQSTKCISVSHEEEASQVVDRCLDEFRISNEDPKDYQLWVVSGKEDAYPLIGHEHPYSIKMSRVRDALKERGEEGRVPTEMQLGADNGSQFILRETRKTAPKICLDDLTKQRTKKPKRSPFPWFRRGKQNSGESAGKLFGHHLSDLCETPDKLPKPVMDLLQYLFIHGPFVPEIFRKSANHRKCQEVRQLLDNGQPVPAELPILVAAALLKEFLRTMADSLLLCDFFDDWLAAVDIEDPRERLKKIKYLVNRLPGCHVTLLRHLVCVLYHVAQRSQENKMTPYNLAVCISQSLLWAHPSQNIQRQTEGAGKVPTLVQILIEDCVEVFDADIVRIFGNLVQSKPRQDSSTDSDSMHSMLSLPDHNGHERKDNSSVDSLERDCYMGSLDMGDTSPQLTKSHLSPTNLSRDSGLTASDPRLYEDGTESEASSVPPRKQSFTRSVSQFEEQPPSADPGPLSSSYDATLNTMHKNTAAPQRPPRMRKVGMCESRTMQQRPVSMSQISAADCRRNRFRQQTSSKRVSEDSLGSVEEYGELPKGSSDDMRRSLQAFYQVDNNMGTLCKSSSGAHLYLTDDSAIPSVLRANKKEHRRSAPPQVFENFQLPTETIQTKGPVLHHNGYNHMTQRESVVAHDDRTVTNPNWMNNNSQQQKQPQQQSRVPVERTATSMSQSIPENKVLNLNGNYPRTTISTSPSHRDTRPQLARSATQETESEQFVHGTYIKGPSLAKIAKDHPNFSRSVPDCSDVPMDVDTSPVSSQGASTTSTPVHYHESMDISEESESYKTLERSVLQTGSVLRKKKGMTKKGSDFFPSKLKHVFNDPSVQMTPATSSSAKSSMYHSNDWGSPIPHENGQSPSLSSQSISRPRESPVSNSGMSQYKTMEKAESNKNVCDSDRYGRPERPPSYEQAMQRRCDPLMSSPTLPDTQLKEQQVNSAKAKRLYEESLKRYEDQTRRERSPPIYRQSRSQDYTPRESSDVPVRTVSRRSESPVKSVSSPRNSPVREAKDKRCPPPYEQACQRAAEIKEAKQRTDPPPYRYRDQYDRIMDRDNHRKSPSRSNSFGSREGTPSRGSKDSSVSRSDSERSARAARRARERRSTSRSRERKSGHRYSDPRLSSSESPGKISTVNIMRSKSDSSEHLDKAGKRKLMTYENKENMSLEDLQRAVRSNRSTPERWTSEERQLSKREEEKNRRKSVPPNLLSSTADKLQTLQMTEEVAPRRRKMSEPASVKDKNWHKELAEQYKGNHFYQPEAQLQSYGYNNNLGRTDSENSGKRKWAPPVHPTKDFVLIYSNNKDKGLSRSQSGNKGHISRTQQQEAELRERSRSDPPHPHKATATNSRPVGGPVSHSPSREETKTASHQSRSASHSAHRSPAGRDQQRPQTVASGQQVKQQQQQQQQSSKPTPQQQKVTTTKPLSRPSGGGGGPVFGKAETNQGKVAQLRNFYNVEKCDTQSSSRPQNNNSPFYTPDSQPPKANFAPRSHQAQPESSHRQPRGQTTTTQAREQQHTSRYAQNDRRPAKERTNPSAELSYI